MTDLEVVRLPSSLVRKYTNRIHAFSGRHEVLEYMHSLDAMK